MSDNPNPLLDQLAHRIEAFIAATGISQRRLAKLVKTNETQLSAFLAGRAGLSAEKSLRLMQILNSSRAQVEAKFRKPAKSMQITHFQENGQTMRLSNDGWVAGGSGSDPVDSTGIDSTPTARDTEGSDDYLRQTIAFLKAQQEIYRQAIGHIDSYLGSIQKAKPNVRGTTEGPRKISDNSDSSKPGSRGDLFSTREHLEYVRAERIKAEQELRLQQELAAERKQLWKARSEATA